MASPYEWNILEWDEKPQTNNEEKMFNDYIKDNI